MDFDARGNWGCGIDSRESCHIETGVDEGFHDCWAKIPRCLERVSAIILPSIDMLVYSYDRNVLNRRHRVLLSLVSMVFVKCSEYGKEYFQSSTAALIYTILKAGAIEELYSDIVSLRVPASSFQLPAPGPTPSCGEYECGAEGRGEAYLPMNGRLGGSRVAGRINYEAPKQCL